MSDTPFEEMKITTGLPEKDEWDEARMDIIGQNGNDGVHYDHIGEDYIDKIKRITGDKSGK